MLTPMITDDVATDEDPAGDPEASTPVEWGVHEMHAYSTAHDFHRSGVHQVLCTPDGEPVAYVHPPVEETAIIWDPPVSLVEPWDRDDLHARPVMGAASGILAIGVVGAEGECVARLLRAEGGLPDTVEFEGPDGRFLIYRYPSNNFRYPKSWDVGSGCGERLGDGIVALADGETVVVPAMRGPGERCRWVEGHRPGERAFADLPRWVVAALAGKRYRAPLSLPVRFDT